MSAHTIPLASLHSATSMSGDLETLRARLVGRLFTVDDPGYDEARRTKFTANQRRPLAVVQAANSWDVAAAVSFARDHGLPLSVRSGGHSVAYYSVIDGAIVADLSQLKRVSIDPGTRIARVQPGATSGDLGDAAREHNLALSTGDTHSVGMGGLTTGGGVGFMVRKYGLAIDSLLSAEVVTAAGELLTASADEHPDLFWAIRGGGGNFGIVTEFTFRLAPVGQILGGELILPASREVLRGYLDYAVSAPEDLTTIAHLMHAPPAPHVPQDHVGERVLAILVCWTGDFEAGERALAPLRALATPIADAISPMPYPDIYRFTAHQAEPHVASLRMMFADDLSDDALDATLTALEHASSPYSIIQFRGLGGAMARVDSEATAFAHRDQRYFVAVIAIWLDMAADPHAHLAWTEWLWQAIRAEGRGAYVNFLQDEGPDRIREAYPGVTYHRLTAIKRRYDPENLFQFNQNIPPALS